MPRSKTSWAAAVIRDAARVHNIPANFAVEASLRVLEEEIDRLRKLRNKPPRRRNAASGRFIDMRRAKGL